MDDRDALKMIVSSAHNTTDKNARIAALEAEAAQMRGELINLDKQADVQSDRIHDLNTEVKRLREALMYVEWVDGPDVADGMGGMMEQICPWCDATGTPDDGWTTHAAGCIRQAALEPQKGDGDEMSTM